MGMLQEVRGKEGDLKLANMSSKIQNLFDMLGFSQIIRIYDTLDQANEAFLTDKKNSADKAQKTPVEEDY